MSAAGRFGRLIVTTLALILAVVATPTVHASIDSSGQHRGRTYVYDSASQVSRVARGASITATLIRRDSLMPVTASAALSRSAAASGFAAEAGGDAATTAGDGTQYAYRIHGGDSGPWGHSWTPSNPLEMDNPRAELGLPKGNTGQYLTKARVVDREGLIERQALPLDGNAGGGPEWLFPDPENQLQELWTITLDEPF